MKKSWPSSILIAVTLLAVAVIADAEQPKKIPRVGFLSPSAISGEFPRFEAFKRRMLSHPDMGTSLTAVWDAVRRALIGAINDPEGPLRSRAAQAMQDLGKRLQTDEALRARVDTRASEAVGYVVRTYGTEIVSVISDTIERWDGQEASARIELHVGRDLQFIRINGTVVGALVGLTIHTLSQLL